MKVSGAPVQVSLRLCKEVRIPCVKGVLSDKCEVEPRILPPSWESLKRRFPMKAFLFVTNEERRYCIVSEISI